MDTLLQDVRYALRTLARTPAFTLAAVATLALGIGANATLFSIVHAALIRPLPYPDPDRIVSLSVAPPGRADDGDATHSYLLEWQRDARTVGHLAAWMSSAANLSGDGPPERIRGARVTASLFPLLGVRLAAGRGFTADGERAGTPGTVILSDRLWRRRFAADTKIVGRSVMLDGVPLAVAGIAPPGFEFPARADFWRPLQLPAPETGMLMYVDILGRLAPGATTASVRAELQAIADRGDATRRQWQRGSRAHVMTFQERRFGGARTLLLVLLGCSAFVLLIACANIAGLLLARASARGREFSLRAALGASRGRLVRLLVTESLVLAGLGGGVALLVPAWGIPLVTQVGSLTALRGLDIRADGVVIAATTAIAVATGLLFGLGPALAATRHRLEGALAGGIGDAPRHARLRQGLVAAQLAVALVLLVGATLLTRSLLRVTAMDLGFQPDRVLAASLSLPRSRYPDAASTRAFYAALLERARALPGVQSAALADAPPLQGFRYTRGISLDGASVPDVPDIEVAFNNVTTDYFTTLGMALVSGRGFVASDRKGSMPVAVVNEAFARRFAAPSGLLGHTINMDGNTPVDPSIVGVVRDVRQIGQDVEVRPEVFLAAEQSDELPEAVVIRTVGDPGLLGAALRRAVLDIDPAQPVSRVFTLRDDLARTTAPRRANAALLGAFSALALLLAALGLYGVMAFLVAQRTREIGVRMALGARPVDIMTMIARQGAGVLIAGCAVGVVASLLVSRALTGLLFEIRATDHATYVVAPALLLLTAALAGYLPARRAARTDPMIAIRSE